VIDVSPAEVASVNTVLDHFSDKTVTVRNTGTGNLLLSQIASMNPLASPFSIENDNCSLSTVSPSGTCTFQVRFSPNTQAAFSDSFDIPSNATNNPDVTVNVSGDGKAFGVAINQADLNGCPQIKLFVSVTDRNDNFVTGLDQTDFSVFENDNPNTLPITVTNTNGLPLSASMPLDYSLSIQPYLGAVELGAKGFVSLLEPYDEAEIIKFATGVKIMQSFTSDKALLDAAIDTDPGFDKGTALFDAVFQATNNVAVRTNPKRAVVLLADGEDNLDSPTLALVNVIENAISKGIPIFSIGIGETTYFEVLQQMSADTGGQFFSSNETNIDNIYSQISDLLKNQYEITYTSQEPVGTPLNVRVEVEDSAGNQGETTRYIGACP